MDARRASATDDRLLNNAVWLLGSIFLAFVVWITANLQSNPVQQQRLKDLITIDYLLDDGVLITSAPQLRASVFVRAPVDVFSVLSEEDVDVVADLRGRPPGRQTVPLEASLAANRQAVVVDISPGQVTVEIEESQERFIPVDLIIVAEPPANFELTDSSASPTQVLVSGAASDVSRVVSAQAELDLAQQEEGRVELDEIRLIPTDVDGQRVADVELSPVAISVSLDIQQRNNVREVRVTPNLVGEPPAGYTLTAEFEHSPEEVFVSGPPEALDDIIGAFVTEPIDLTDRTESFETTVTIDLPNDELFLLTGQVVTVSVGIDVLQSSRSFEEVPIEVVGLQEGASFEIVPEVVRVLVNGPQPSLTALEPDDVRVVADLSEITESGSAQVVPIASISDGEIDPESISILPDIVDITVEVP